jgi:hypothetical protein
MDARILDARAIAASDLVDKLSDRQGTQEFWRALERLAAVAEQGSIEAAEHLAEIQACSGPHHNAESAYMWYFIALSQQGYKTDFQDQNGIPPSYGGPDGDFRNESMVSDLVSEIGFERVRELDKEASAWLMARNLTGHSSRRP